MIRNGFIKDIDGDWISLAEIHSIQVINSNIDTYDKKDNSWEIRAFFEDRIIGEEDDGYILIENEFATSEEAHNRLFFMMNGID